MPAVEDGPSSSYGVCADGTFPHTDDGPACLLSQFGRPKVPFLVPAQLLSPQVRVGAGEGNLPAMLGARVPVVTVYEDRDPSTGQHQVGGTAGGDSAV